MFGPFIFLYFILKKKPYVLRHQTRWKTGLFFSRRTLLFYYASLLGRAAILRMRRYSLNDFLNPPSPRRLGYNVSRVNRKVGIAPSCPLEVKIFGYIWREREGFGEDRASEVLW